MISPHTYCLISHYKWCISVLLYITEADYQTSFKSWPEWYKIDHKTKTLHTVYNVLLWCEGTIYHTMGVAARPVTDWHRRIPRCLIAEVVDSGCKIILLKDHELMHVAGEIMDLILLDSGREWVLRRPSQDHYLLAITFLNTGLASTSQLNPRRKVDKTDQ